MGRGRDGGRRRRARSSSGSESDSSRPGRQRGTRKSFNYRTKRLQTVLRNLLLPARAMRGGGGESRRQRGCPHEDGGSGRSRSRSLVRSGRHGSLASLPQKMALGDVNGDSEQDIAPKSGRIGRGRESPKYPPVRGKTAKNQEQPMTEGGARAKEEAESSKSSLTPPDSRNLARQRNVTARKRSPSTFVHDDKKAKKASRTSRGLQPPTKCSIIKQDRRERSSRGPPSEGQICPPAKKMRTRGNGGGPGPVLPVNRLFFHPPPFFPLARGKAGRLRAGSGRDHQGSRHGRVG